MGEPFAKFGGPGELAWPSPWLAQRAKDDAEWEAKAEATKAEERVEAAEDRAEFLIQRYRQAAVVTGRPGVDLNRPETFVPSPAELAERAFRLDDQPEMTITAPVAALVAAGLVTVLDIPISERAAAPPSAEELAEERVEVAATRARYRTEHAGVVAKIRRALAGKGTR